MTLPEGAVVTIVTREPERVRLTPDEEARLLEAVAEADRANAATVASTRAYDASCGACQWGCRMAVAMIIDQTGRGHPMSVRGIDLLTRPKRKLGINNSHRRSPCRAR